MGGAELMAELNMSIDDPAWKKTWTDFCADSGEVISLGKMQAYAYAVTKDATLAQSAVATLRTSHNIRVGRAQPPNVLAPMDDGTDTNGSSQNGLNAIVVLELCADALPTAAPTGGGAGTPAAADGGA
jgi:Tfp pilus assembly protein PilV